MVGWIGAIEANFEKLTLTVPVQNRKVILRIEAELIKASISMKMIKGTMLESDQGLGGIKKGGRRKGSGSSS